MRRFVALWVGVVCTTACVRDPEATTDSASDSDHPPERVTKDLVDNSLWQQRAADDDPLASHRPAEVDCGIAGAFVEDTTLEINTNRCNYYAAAQPLLVDLQAGDTVTLELRHFDLVAPEPAVAHVYIAIGGDLVWEQNIEIPGPAFVYEAAWDVITNYPAGTPVDIHLHNHGQNTWTLAWIRGDVVEP